MVRCKFAFLVQPLAADCLNGIATARIAPAFEQALRMFGRAHSRLLPSQPMAIGGTC